MTRFPGRGCFEIALALPLTFPAYVLAYAYTDLLDHPGWCRQRWEILWAGARGITGSRKSGLSVAPLQC